MKKRLVRATVIGSAIALVVAASAMGKPEVVRFGNLFLRDDGGITPKRLSRHEQVPITAHLNAQIGTTDGTHPPAIESLDAEFDKSIELDAVGLPACKRTLIVATSTASAKKACPEAIVGTGEAEVQVAFPEQEPFSATGPITLFNGGVQGGTTLLLIHTYVDVPAPTAVIATVKITKVHRGHFGLDAVAAIPRIAGGAGSVTAFKITIGRSFTYKGKKQSYLTASCPTGTYYTEGEVEFSDATKLHITHALPCTPIGT
jgi:hypothetical protein